MIKGRSWWWYTGGVFLCLASLTIRLSAVQEALLPLLWVWPIAVWSSMGVRERRHRTTQLLASMRHPDRQLLAVWAAGVFVAASFVLSVGIRLFFAGQWTEVLTLAVGTLFVPSLALASGVWSGTRHLFEGMYLLLWFTAPESPLLDFMGSNVETTVVTTLGFFTCTVLLLVLTVVGRHKRLSAE